MNVRFVSGMDMLNLSRAFAKIMSGAASVSPVYTTILDGGINKTRAYETPTFVLKFTFCQNLAAG